MANCVNDFTPLIAAIATLITVQFPVVITLLVNQYKIKKGVDFSRGQNRQIIAQNNLHTDMLEYSYYNGKGNTIDVTKIPAEILENPTMVN